MTLHNENIRATDAFAKAWANFSVGKLNEIVLSKIDTEKTSDFLRQCWVGAARIQRHSFGRDFVYVVQLRPPLLGDVMQIIERDGAHPINDSTQRRKMPARIQRKQRLAPGRGLEPLLVESKSTVLPLDDPGRGEDLVRVNRSQSYLLLTTLPD
jgi:hypothetical protein